MNVFRCALYRYLHFAFLLLVTGIAANPAFPSSDEWDYVMRPGDTLIGIAERHFTDRQAWPLVQQSNNIADPYKIPTGTHLKIPTRLLRTTAVAAEVLMVNGQAGRIGVDGTVDQPLMAGSLLQVGDSVRIAVGSNLSLRFPDGTRLLVLENSKFTLRQADRLGASDMIRIQIVLSEGRIESKVTPTPGGANAFEIKTPPLRMAVRGTRFRAAADPLSKQAGSEVLAGQVQISGVRKSVMLGAGFGSYAVLGLPPQAPQRLAPRPVLLDPLARYEHVPLRFAWKAMPSAQGYRAQVLDSSANLVLDSVFQDNVARWADLPDGRYTLRVRTIGENHLEGLDAEHAFTLKARPEPPFATGPKNKAYGESTQFDWTETEGVGSYHFQLASDASFTLILAEEPALATNKVTRPLVPGHYFWRVASIDQRGDHGPFGDISAFEQRPVPASPQAEAPEVGDDQLNFRWRAGEPGQHYLLQISKTPDFSELLLEQTSDTPDITVPRPQAGEYFMRVKAIEADGFVGPFGSTQRFSVPGTSAWWLLLLLLPIAL